MCVACNDPLLAFQGHGSRCAPGAAAGAGELGLPRHQPGAWYAHALLNEGVLANNLRCP